MKKKKSLESKLHEVEGILQPSSTNEASIARFKKRKRKQPDAAEYISKLRAGNISFLSRAITLIESTHPKHQELAAQVIEGCLPFANNSVRIGITGVPGAGKSTFIESFGKCYTSKGHKVAVLAIDPSSTVHKGSILGDKTRMEELVRDKNAFIRPSPSGSSLGGVAQKTRAAIVLCEAAGFDIVFIETVGVGQNETVVHSMVDFFLLLKLAGAGDELQGIKRGIIEMADCIVINKADKDNIKRAELAKADFERALHLYPVKESEWQPKVSTCSALNNQGIDAIKNLISEYLKLVKDSGYFEKHRNEQNKYWLHETIKNKLYNSFYTDPEIVKALANYETEIQNLRTTPFSAAQALLELFEKQRK